MYGALMIARQSITVPGVKTLHLLLITIMANGGKWGVDTLRSESFPTCLPLRLARGIYSSMKSNCFPTGFFEAWNKLPCFQIDHILYQEYIRV